MPVRATDGLDMKRKKKKLSLLLMISIAFLFQMAAAHSYYDSLIEADFLGNGLKFEAADLETLCVDKQTHFHVEMSQSSITLPALQWSEVLLPHAIPSPSSAEAASVLRC